MTKTLIASLLLAASTVASAQTTVPLIAEECTSNRFCYNADGAGTLLYASAAGIVEVFMPDGSVYLGRGPVGLSIVSFPVYRQPDNDAVMYVTADWRTWTTKGSGSGRGGYAVHTHWALLGGSLLVLP